MLIGLPLAVGLVMGLNQVRLGAHLPLSLSVVFWTLGSVGVWLIFEAIGRAVAVVLRPWAPPLLLVLASTMLAGSIFGRSYLFLLVDYFRQFIVDGSAPREPVPFNFSSAYFAEFFRSWAGYFIFWLTANLVLVELLGVERFGFKKTPSGQPSTMSDPVGATVSKMPYPEFLTRIPGARSEDVISLSAQDHYLEVRTIRAKHLIHYAISDAISQLQRSGVPGYRIHRSHWVSQDAIEKTIVTGRHYMLSLKTGGELPVGQTYVELLRKDGIIPAKGSVAQNMTISAISPR